MAVRALAGDDRVTHLWYPLMLGFMLIDAACRANAAMHGQG